MQMETRVVKEDKSIWIGSIILIVHVNLIESILESKNQKKDSRVDSTYCNTGGVIVSI